MLDLRDSGLLGKPGETCLPALKPVQQFIKYLLVWSSRAIAKSSCLSQHDEIKTSLLYLCFTAIVNMASKESKREKAKEVVDILEEISVLLVRRHSR